MMAMVLLDRMQVALVGLVVLSVAVAVAALGTVPTGETVVRQAQMPDQVAVVVALAKSLQVMVVMGQLVLFFLFIREVPSQDYPEVKVPVAVVVRGSQLGLAVRQVRRFLQFSPVLVGEQVVEERPPQPGHMLGEVQAAAAATVVEQQVFV